MLDVPSFIPKLQPVLKPLLPLALSVHTSVFALVGCDQAKKASEQKVAPATVEPAPNPVHIYKNNPYLTSARSAFVHFRNAMKKPDSALDIVLETYIATEIMQADEAKEKWIEAARRAFGTSVMSPEKLMNEFIFLMDENKQMEISKESVYFIALLAEYHQRKTQKEMKK